LEEKNKKLINAIQLWLKKNDLFTDTTFYSVDDWIKREEDYHNNSEFVIISEGGLWQILNYGSNDSIYEFEDLVESMGYFYEIGNHWNFGFYKEEIDHKKTEGTYSMKLRDPRWIKKSKLVKEIANHTCRDCGNKSNLEVHHCFYQYGREPWEYPFDSLRCLCSTCHKRRGNKEIVLRAKLAEIDFNGLEALEHIISNATYWYKTGNLYEFLSSIGSDTIKMREKYIELVKSKKT